MYASGTGALSTHSLTQGESRGTLETTCTPTDPKSNALNSGRVGVDRERSDMHVLPHMSSVPSSLSLRWSSARSDTFGDIPFQSRRQSTASAESVHLFNQCFLHSRTRQILLRCVYILSEPWERCQHISFTEPLCLQHSTGCRTSKVLGQAV